MPNDYCDADDIKAVAPDQTWSTAYDALLTLYATRASREIDRFTNRAPGAYAVTTASDRYFTGNGSLEIYPDEMAEAPSAVAVAETGDLSSLTAWSTAADVRPIPYNAADKGEPYEGLEIDIVNGSKSQWPAFPKAIKVTAKWGYSSTVPDEVKQAAIVQAFKWFKRGQQGYQEAGGTRSLGQLRQVESMDLAVAEMIAHLRKQAV